MSAIGSEDAFKIIQGERAKTERWKAWENSYKDEHILKREEGWLWEEDPGRTKRGTERLKRNTGTKTGSVNCVAEGKMHTGKAQ